MKKVVRISTNKFIHKINPMNIVTCDHIKDAMDISGLPFSVLDGVLHRLYNLGYRECKVLEVKNG